MTQTIELSPQVRIHAFASGLLQANTYVVETPDGSALIDPGGEPMPPLPVVSLDAIICTHGHFDHIAGADDLRIKTGAPAMIHADDADAFIDAARNASVMIGLTLTLRPADRLLRDGDAVPLGTGHQLLVMATPGHTPGGICLLLEAKDRPGEPIALFSGDTLFRDSIGRLDIGGDADAMRQSLLKLQQLPDSLAVYPGHGQATTIGRERRSNPFLRSGGLAF